MVAVFLFMWSKKYQTTAHCPNPLIVSFFNCIATEYCLFTYVLSMAAFVLQWQGWSVAIETLLSERHLSGALQKKMVIPALVHYVRFLIFFIN